MTREWPWALAGTVVALTSTEALIRMDGYLGAAAAAVVGIFGALALAYKLTEHDSLTGTLGRAAILRRSHHALTHCRREGGAIGAASLDIERFGTINFLHGRAAGDSVLREVASRLVKACPPSALVSRLHGDEFLVVFVGESEESIGRECVKLCVALRDALVAPIRTAHANIEIRVRIGVDIRSGCYKAGFSADDLVRNSDIARRQPVNSYPSRGYSLFDQKMAEMSGRHAWIECEIPSAIRDREVVLAYQPIVDVRTRKVVKCEALLRWTSPKRGAVGPDEFIPIAEVSGQMEVLGWFVIHQVCAQFVLWREEGRADMPVAVNVSPSQLRNPMFGEELLRTLNRYSVLPRLLEIEITEGVIIDDNPVIRMNLRTLECAGIAVSLDDFGTGFSSLSSLAALSIQGLKIDKSFVNALSEEHGNRRERRLVESICALAAAMGVIVVAEGVDSAAKAAELQQYGVHLMQGYLYSQAVPPENLNAVAKTLLSGGEGFKIDSVLYPSASTRLQ